MTSSRTNLYLSLSVALRKHLFEARLEYAYVVIDDGFLFCRIILPHYAHQREISARALAFKISAIGHRNSLVDFAQV